MKDPKNSIKKLIEIIDTFDKVAGYKTNTQKSVDCLYTKKMNRLRKTLGKIPFIIASKNTWNKFSKGNQRHFQ
jgi:hypothetical protein